MKFPLIFSTIILAAMAWALLGGCSTAPKVDPAVAAIQKSCDDEQSPQTVINGHTYFCMDYNTFQQKMQAIAHELQLRGV